MKIKSTLPAYPPGFVRRATAWACKSMGLPVQQIGFVEVRRVRENWTFSGQFTTKSLPSGQRAGCLVLRMGELGYPCKFRRNDIDHYYETPLHAFVYVLAHEAAHCWHWWRERNGAAKTRRNGRHSCGSERLTDIQAQRVYQEWLANAEALLAEWRAESKRQPKPQISAVEKRAAKAAENLATWVRKAKLAKTKVAKYRRAVRYYERKAASSRPDNRPQVEAKAQ